MNELIDTVLEHIVCHVNDGDLTAVEELLKYVPRENLIAFLPEELWDKFPQSINFIKEE